MDCTENRHALFSSKNTTHFDCGSEEKLRLEQRLCGFNYWPIDKTAMIRYLRYQSDRELLLFVDTDEVS